MTTKFSWNELKKLVVLDHEINQLKKTVQSDQEILESIKKPLAIIEQNKEKQALLIKEAQKQIDSLELCLAQLKQDQSHKNELLTTLSHPKEYDALEHERNQIEQSITEVEDKILAQLEIQEVAEKELAQAVNAYKDAEIAAIEKTQEIQQALSGYNDQISSLQVQWNEQLTCVPSELMHGYTEIRSRVPNPVVPVVASSCSACFYRLLHQDDVALTTRSVIRCRGCYRFLFTQNELDDAAQPTEGS